MKDMLEKLKHIPIPIWIGLGLVFIFILLMNRNSSSSGTTAGPVTANTVGSQGSQAGAGTDQQLGNLSQMMQTNQNQLMQSQQAGLHEIASQNAQSANAIMSALSGVGGNMQQLGSAVQTSQNASAQQNAVSGTAGQNAGMQPSGVSNHTLVGHFKVALPGGGDVTVNANSAQAAIENAAQETGMDTSHSNVTTLSPPHSDI